MRINKPQSVEERFASLSHWQHRKKDKFNLTEFARAGFFFDRLFDTSDDPGRLRCAFCSAVISNWRPEDDPWREHALSVDHCPHVEQHKGADFVERVKNDEEEEMEETQTNLEHFMITGEENFDISVLNPIDLDLFGMEMGAMRQEHNKSCNNTYKHQDGMGIARCCQQPGGALGSSSTHCSRRSDLNMGSKETRLASFDDVGYLFENDTLLHRIADSGFYFEGVGVYGIKVRCFSCSSAQLDICDDDDPWTLHEKNCAYVIQRKGQDFIQNQSIRTEDKEIEPASSDCQTKKRKSSDSGRNDSETAKRPRNQRSVQSKGPPVNQNLSGFRRIPRFYSYNGRWCRIKWRPLFQRLVRRRNGRSEDNDSEGRKNFCIVVFLCCGHTVLSLNKGQGACPRCDQNKYV